MSKPTKKRGLQLDKVVLLGRTLEEYRRFFLLDPADWEGKSILDVAGGVGSFTAETSALGLNVTAADPIYSIPPEQLAARCAADLDIVFKDIGKLNTYRWDPKGYESPESLRRLREKAWRGFLSDYALAPKGRYVPASLPKLPFEEGAFDLTLVSYFLFVYEAQFSYQFHRDSIRELLRITRGEVRIYPLMTFDGERSSCLDRLLKEPEFSTSKFEIIETDFEFLIGSNNFLKITRP